MEGLGHHLHEAQLQMSGKRLSFARYDDALGVLTFYVLVPWQFKLFRPCTLH